MIGMRERCCGRTRRRGRTNIPDSVVTSSVGDARGIAILRDITMDVLHQEIGGEDAIDEVPPDVRIVEVVLEQRRDLEAAQTPVSAASQHN